jgi:hypothetical protein
MRGSDHEPIRRQREQRQSDDEEHERQNHR